MNNNEINTRPLTLMEWIGKKLSMWILYILGWKPLNVSQEQIQKIKTNQRNVLTISHTSVLDGLIFYIYKFAHPEIFENALVVVKPQIFDGIPKFLHPILNKMGLVKATAHEEKNGGFIQSTIDTLKDKKEFMFIISPKGKIINSPWRSGYYVIAKELNCKILPCGLDYDKKCLSFVDPFSVDNHSKNDLDVLIQHKLGNITPLRLKNSEFPIHKETSKSTVITISFFVIALILFLSYLGWNYKILFFAVLLLLFILI
jgi:hypothetical protein